MTRTDPDTPLWTPSTEHVVGTRMAAFAAYVRGLSGRPVAAYADLHRWSIDEPAQFWRAVWDFSEIIGTPGERVLVSTNAFSADSTAANALCSARMTSIAFFNVHAHRHHRAGTHRRRCGRSPGLSTRT